MSDHHDDFGIALGLAIGLRQMNAANQANAEYNSIRQGYMTQGFGVEQATALTNFYYAPIHRRNAINYRRTKAYGWSAVAWYLAALFLFFTAITSIGDSSSTSGDGTATTVTTMFFVAAAGCALVPLYHRSELNRLLAEPEPSSDWTCGRCGRTSSRYTSVDALVQDVATHPYGCRGVRVVDVAAGQPEGRPTQARGRALPPGR